MKNRRPEVYIDKIIFVLHIFLALNIINVIRSTEKFHDSIIIVIHIYTNFKKLLFSIDYNVLCTNKNIYMKILYIYYINERNRFPEYIAKLRNIVVPIIFIKFLVAFLDVRWRELNFHKTK